MWINLLCENSINKANFVVFSTPIYFKYTIIV
nr:MAG TPA: FMN-dependent NADH-azoreductase [Caudoviricetes sp.]